jgi:hypothetical protein
VESLILGLAANYCWLVDSMGLHFEPEHLAGISFSQFNLVSDHDHGDLALAAQVRETLN